MHLTIHGDLALSQLNWQQFFLMVPKMLVCPTITGVLHLIRLIPESFDHLGKEQRLVKVLFDTLVRMCV